MTASTNASGVVTLNFINTGLQGAVFHVFDQLNLNLIPRRYTVEAGKTLSDDFWNTFSANFVSAPQGTYNLWVYGPNGFVRVFQGRINAESAFGAVQPTVEVAYDVARGGLRIEIRSNAQTPVEFTVTDNAYGSGHETILVRPFEVAQVFWSARESGNWYDISVASAGGFCRQFAGRMEDGRDHITDPKMGRQITPYTNAALS